MLSAGKARKAIPGLLSQSVRLKKKECSFARLGPLTRAGGWRGGGWRGVGGREEGAEGGAFINFCVRGGTDPITCGYMSDAYQRVMSMIVLFT